MRAGPSSPTTPARAFVLGAGLGTRLGLLTERRPKPLIPICQKPLITFAFDHLIENGIGEFVVNTHHCAEAYAAAFNVHEGCLQASYRGLPVHLRHEPVRLETAGGIKNVGDLLSGEPFIVYNGDILTDLPLEPAIRFHREHGNEVTLVLRSSGGPLQVTCESGRVTDIGGRLSKEGVVGSGENYLFTGIYLVEPEFLERIPAGVPLSVVPVFTDMIRQGARLGGVIIDDGNWWDLGTRDSYLQVHRHFLKSPHFRTAPDQPWPVWVESSAEVENAKLLGATAIGAGARIGAGAELTDCIVWENAVISGDARLQSCIVTAGRHLGGTHSNLDV